MVVEDLIQYRVIYPPGGLGVMNEPRIVHLYARRKAVVSEISTVFSGVLPTEILGECFEDVSSNGTLAGRICHQTLKTEDRWEEP